MSDYKASPAQRPLGSRFGAGGSYGRGAQRNPCHALSPFSFQELVASLMPKPNLVDFVVEDEITAIRAYHEHSMTCPNLV